MQVSTPAGARSVDRRAYMVVDSSDLLPTEGKETQTDLGTGKTSFVTARPVLSTEQAAASNFARSFEDLRARIRSPAWRCSLLIVLGHDSEKRRDELERRICEDEAAEVVDNELRDFFDAVLAPMVQQRETTLVNTMQECFQHELQTQQLVIQRQEKRVAALMQQIEDWEKQVVHLKAKVDRRVNENNTLRKEQYRQLLMLRDIVSKQSSEPGALSALNEAITTVLTGKQEVQARQKTHSGSDHDQAKSPAHGWAALNANTQTLHRERGKWEERAREASLECQELREKIAHLMQENKAYRTSATIPWFLDPESAIAERQRIADAVCHSQGNWEDVGDSLAELLNNDLLWAAVEQSARRGGKHRVARGLEAALAQLDSQSRSPIIENDAVSDKDEVAITPPPTRRRSTFAELGRLIPCRTCNGAGYVQTELSENGANDSDSYLRKTLEQVLELKKQLEKANTKTLTLEGELQLAHMHTAQLQEKLQHAELIKSTAVDSCLQTELDEEEGIDIDEIMRSAYGQDIPTPQMYPRQNRRNAQYEHLIVELKSTLADKDEGLNESRKALEVAQTRAVKLQRALQKEKDTHAQELAMLKTSLAFSLKTRNNKIEERQAAVKLLLKKFVQKTQQSSLLKPSDDASALTPMDESTHGEESDVESDSTDDNAEGADENGQLSTNDHGNEKREVKRMESLAQRYAEDIVRVRKEHEVQQELLKKAETEIAEVDEKRSRTNSISQGSLVVSMASHPRDLFKALTTAQTEMLNVRRASQRSSALQTDRLLTLTTHLSHMSEELCTLRKRNLAEIEYWKLECEKLQNTNKALEAEQQLYQRELQTAREHHAELSGDSALGICSMCEKHKARLMMISNQLLGEVQVPRANPEVDASAPVILTDSERKTISSILLDLQSTYSGMTAAKQDLARRLIAAHLGTNLNPRSAKASPSRSNSKVVQSNNQDAGKGGFLPALPKASTSSPRKFSGFTSAKSKRDMKKLIETSATDQQASQSPTRKAQATSPQQTIYIGSNLESNSEPGTKNAVASEPADMQKGIFQSHHRKTLVQEILDEGGFLLTKHGLAVDAQCIEVHVPDNVPGKPFDNNPEQSEANLSPCAIPRDRKNDEPPEDAQHIGDEDDSFPYEEGIPLLNCVNSSDRNPEIVDQLRYLINQSNTAKERLAVAGWKLFVGRILLIKSQHRLNELKFISDKRVKVHPNGAFRPESRKVTSLRFAMEKCTQLHEATVQGATSTQELSRRECKKAQTHLICSVSMLLENLSRNGKLTAEFNETSYLMQLGSPRRSPTSNRLLYPAAKIHLNRIPPTQQIPTLTFPDLVTTRSSSEFLLDQYSRPNISRDREGSAEGFSYGEGYHLPHRLIKSAGPRGMGPFVPVHSSVATLQGSMPFPDPVRIQDIYESGRINIAGESRIPTLGLQRPLRPHSSPAGPRLMSPRTQGMISSASSQLKLPGAGSTDNSTPHVAMPTAGTE